MIQHGHFSEYIDTFVKKKAVSYFSCSLFDNAAQQEASGWPESIVEAEKQGASAEKLQKLQEKFISDFLRKEGIKLDASAVSYNAPARASVKLLLNSLVRENKFHE